VTGNDHLCAAFLAAMADRPDDLNAIEAEAVRAVFVERRSVPEAVRVLGVNRHTLAHRVARARRWLRAWEGMRRAA